MSGRSCLIARDSRHAAERSISVRGASGRKLEPFVGAPPQLAVGVRDQHRAMADRAQAQHGDEHLVLPAAPGPRGVDVQREHQRVRRRAVRRCSSHSFASFRKT